MSHPIYYKATRPNGTDFYTGQLQYKVDKRVRPLPTKSKPHICGPGVLHAAYVPSMTLIGGSWPCRLFEVTGKPFDGFDATHRHKGAFRQLTVVREIDAHLALGPNGRYVAGVIKRTRQLTYQEAVDLRAAWGAAWGAARDAAWGAARGATRGAARGAAWDAARGAAWGAAIALLVRDLISDEHFDSLYGPWAKVIDGKDTK